VKMTIARAKELAADILIELANRPQDLGHFISESGLQPDELHHLADRPDIILFLLDFLAEDDERLISFSANLNLRPQDIMSARTALSGPGSYGWTAD